MANFIGLVYATLKNEGVDTKGMSTDEAVAKFKELQKKSGGDTGKEGTPAEQRKLEEKGVVDKEVDSYELSDSDTYVIDDAIHWVKKNGLDLTVDNVIKQINEDMSGFMPNQNDSKGKAKYNSIVNYIKEQYEDNTQNSVREELNDEAKKIWDSGINRLMSYGYTKKVAERSQESFLEDIMKRHNGSKSDLIIRWRKDFE